MITCPKCDSGNWRTLHRSPIRPAEDQFQCNNCGHKFRRYDEAAPAAVSADDDQMIQTPYGKKRWSFLKRAIDSHEELLAACERALPWIGKLIADGGHMASVAPNDAVRAMQMLEAAIKKAGGKL
jgi:Zn ribbon nucleic-acid-binding protein